ncbi:MAG: translation initiation factor IF-2, partial [Calditrichaeota bacterium]|nr:translation initiation factor IF-2 [Calditrichota bacterium]
PEPEPVEENKPQVGDIIDHPMAKQYLERQKREKKAREERLKKAKETQGTEQPAAAAEATGETTDGEASAEDKAAKARKKDTKKERQEEKDARRRKALEMLKREGKRLRPQQITEISEEGDAKSKDGRKRRKKKKKEVDQKEVDSALKKTLAEMRDTAPTRKRRKKFKSEGEEEFEEVNVVKVTEFITTQDLANLLDVTPTQIIAQCLQMGLVVTINQRLDMDSIKLLAEEFGYEVEQEEEFGSEFLEENLDEDPDDEKTLRSRTPIVTIMGHVDHGKTSLLDYIRRANVVAGEAGGITQHIGAYEVELDDGRHITFLDTPGHEAFTAMRARGAQVTDIVVLVIAADDRVMPQTEEALDHAKAAGVSIVIALNKVDRPDANPDAIRKQLADRNILVEDWGGQVQCVEVSAKTGQNVEDLMEKILLEAELLELKANPDKNARGVVLEAQLDKGKGPVATLLVQAGTLRVGDSFIVGQHSGRVRAMFNERGGRVDEAGPSTPVQVLGIDGIPEAGDRFIVMADEREVRDVAQRRQQLKREQDFRQVKLMTLDELSRQIQSGDVKELNILVKADVDGSAQALTDSLLKISNDEVEVKVIRRAVGPIAESDVILAAASRAIIIGFNVRPTLKAKELADKEMVDIRQYRVIYDAIEDVEKALEGMLSPIEREVVTGSAEVREVFKISRIGTIAGCYVLNGSINRNARVRLVRNDVEIYTGTLASLKRFKDDVRDVQSGYECGMAIENFNDLKQGDIIEAFEIVKEAQTLKR